MSMPFSPGQGPMSFQPPGNPIFGYHPQPNPIFGFHPGNPVFGFGGQSSPLQQLLALMQAEPHGNFEMPGHPGGPVSPISIHGFGPRGPVTYNRTPDASNPGESLRGQPHLNRHPLYDLLHRERAMSAAMRSGRAGY